jgi:SET domain-containing protein
MARGTRGNGRPFILRKSDIHGKGAFATKWIKKGTRLIEYKGERITDDEADARYEDEDESQPHHTFLFSLDDGTVVDAAVRGNAARFINHSCEPNCEAVIEQERIYIDAIRDIAPGEELFYDYAFIIDERHTAEVKARYPCHCGSDSCRGTILAPKNSRR